MLLYEVEPANTLRLLVLSQLGDDLLHRGLLSRYQFLPSDLSRLQGLSQKMDQLEGAGHNSRDEASDTTDYGPDQVGNLVAVYSP